MKDRTKYAGLVWTVGCFVTTVFPAFGVFVYLAYGSATEPVIFNNLPTGPSVNCIKVLLCLVVYASLPLKMFSASACLDTLLFSPSSSKNDLDHKSSKGGQLLAIPGVSTTTLENLMRCALAVASTVLAVWVPDFQFLMSFIGALCLGVIGFILPPLMYIRLKQGHGARARPSSTTTQGEGAIINTSHGGDSGLAYEMQRLTGGESLAPAAETGGGGELCLSPLSLLLHQGLVGVGVLSTCYFTMQILSAESKHAHR